MPGSGKEEFVKIAIEQGFLVVRMGDVVRAEVRAQGLEASDEKVGGFAAFEREKFGMGIWAQRTVSLVKGDLVLIELDVCVEGYWADLTRTIVVGRATKQQKRIYNTVLDAQTNAFEALKDGESAFKAI